MDHDFRDDETARLFERLDRADSTLVAYGTAIRKFEDWWFAEDDRPITEVPSSAIQDYLTHLHDEGYADNTILKHKQALSTLYNVAESQGGESPRGATEPIPSVDENPVDGVDMNNVGDDRISPDNKKKTASDNTENIVYLSRDETRKLRESVPAPKLRNRLILKILIQTGARRNEVISIHKEKDVNRDSQTLKLTDSKTGKERQVPYNDLSPELDAWMNKHRAKYITASESPYLFIGHGSEQLNSRRIGEIVRKAADNAGIQETLYTDSRGRGVRRVTPHALRHTFAIRALEAGMPIHALKELMGHSDIDVTQTYLQITQDDAASEYHDANVTFT